MAHPDTRLAAVGLGRAGKVVQPTIGRRNLRILEQPVQACALEITLGSGCDMLQCTAATVLRVGAARTNPVLVRIRHGFRDRL